MLTRSRGMGASAVLGLAVLASYGALAAVALSAVGGGSVLSFPGWAVDAIIQVNAAPPAPTAQYGTVTATPTASPTGGQAVVVTPPAPAAGTTVAVSTGKHGDTGASQGGSGTGGGRRFGHRQRRRLQRRPAARSSRSLPGTASASGTPCVSTTAASIPDQPARRHHDHDGLDSDHHRAWHHPPRHGQRSHHQHHAWHHPPRHGNSPPSHHHHRAWHHPPRHGHSPPVAPTSPRLASPAAARALAAGRIIITTPGITRRGTGTRRRRTIITTPGTTRRGTDTTATATTRVEGTATARAERLSSDRVDALDVPHDPGALGLLGLHHARARRERHLAELA